MNRTITSAIDLIRKVYILARPYGRKKLILITSLSFAQGLFQVLGVTSIFPFLALAADPERLRNSQFGTKFLEALPPMEDNQILVVAGVFAIVMLLVANGVNLGSEFARTGYASQFGHWLRVRLLRQIASRPYTHFLQINTGILLKKVNDDVMGYTNHVLLPILDGLARGATVILLIATLFLVHPEMAAAATIGLGIFYVAVYRGLGRLRNSISEGTKKASRGTSIELQQMLGGIKPLKVHRAEEAFIGRFSGHSANLARLQARTSILGNAPRYLIEPLAFGGLVAVVLVYVTRGQNLIAILPNLGVMALAGYRLLPAIQLLYNQANQLNTQRHTLEEVFDEFLAAEQDQRKDTESADGNLSAPERLKWQRSITLENLCFQYPGSEKLVIDRLSLTIPKNSSLGIVGTTGCGKSTLVDLILGLHTPSSGRILIDDVPLGPDNRRAWRGGIGYVPQDIFLIDDTVAANIAFGVPEEKVDQEALLRSARAAQILEFIQKELPNGWQTIVGERGVRLSGGQRQRLALARALYHQPDLLILDEATSALDNTTESLLIEAIQELSRKLTIIIIAHRLSTLNQVDHILSLDEAILNPTQLRC
jgi:ABC-type multidrug transport system fused ATPase/permease subunit